MDPLTQGVVIYAIVVGFITMGMALTVAQARNESEGGAALVPRLLPYLVAEGVFTAVFILWLLDVI